MFKLVGPVLIKQDQAEAKSNIAKRLEFIRSEMCVFANSRHVCSLTADSLSLISSRVEGQIKEMEGKSDSKRAEVCQSCPHNDIDAETRPARRDADGSRGTK